MNAVNSNADEMLEGFSRAYLDARRSGYSFRYFLSCFGRPYILAAAAVLLTLLALRLLDADSAFYVFLGGVLAGGFLRDLRWFLFMRASWYAGALKLIDWTLVERVAAGKEAVFTAK